MRKLTFKTIVFLLLGLCFSARAQQQDKLLQLLKQELQYNMRELKKQEHVPYYMSLRASETYNLTLTSFFGAISGFNEVNVRTLVP